MVIYLVMVMVDVKVEEDSSATANRGRSAVATMVLSCIATKGCRGILMYRIARQILVPCFASSAA